ncbi:MAG: peptidase dimerization domain-containing protein [Candidatus Xenobiia bacterium LiM19]
MRISQSIDNLDFTMTVYGKAAPSCSSERGVSAIDNAFMYINRLRDWSMSLPEESDRLNTAAVESPLIITAIKGGEWVGAVPVKCVFKGTVRITLSRSIQEVKSVLLDCFHSLAGESEHRSSRLPSLSFDTPVNGAEVGPGLISQTEILPGTVPEFCGTENYET